MGSKRFSVTFVVLATLATSVFFFDSTCLAQTVLFSDDFNDRTTIAFDAGMNNNALGGALVQTYEVSPDPGNGNNSVWIDEEEGEHVAKLSFAHMEIDFDWASNPDILAAGGMRLEFDYQGPEFAVQPFDWLGVTFGLFDNTDEFGGIIDFDAPAIDPGNDHLANLNRRSTDFAFLFRNEQFPATGEPGSVVAVRFPGSDLDGSPGTRSKVNPEPLTGPYGFRSVRIDLINASGTPGSEAEVLLFFDGTQIDLDPLASGVQGLTFTWDNDGAYTSEAAPDGLGANYISFGSNAGVARIDNIVISTLPTNGGIDGDFNGDDVVNLADYTVWRDALGSSAPLANDGGLGTPVGTAHYDLWKSNFGQPANPTSLSVAVPEPNTLGLSVGVLALFGLADRRRGRTVKSPSRC